MQAAQNAAGYDLMADRAATRLMDFLAEQEIVTVEDYFEPALREHLGEFVPVESRNIAVMASCRSMPSTTSALTM